MYDRAPRFHKFITATPENVGPATYLLSDIFDRDFKAQCGCGKQFPHVQSLSDGAILTDQTPTKLTEQISGFKTFIWMCSLLLGTQAPFNSYSWRTISFTNKNLIENPSPNRYKVCFRRRRVTGGTSIQNIAPRFNYKNKDYIIGPDLTKEAKQLPGHVHRGVPPRNSCTQVTTIPEKGAEGYLITDDGLVKIYNPPQNRPVGPMTYYNPGGHDNYTTLQYRGNFWSLRTAKRFRYKIQEGPSPAEYTVIQKNVSTWKKYQDMLRSMNEANAPSLRHDDVVLRKLCRENLPGPGAYSPYDLNSKKCECGKEGTFPKSKRGSLYKISEGPGPAAYSDPRTALDKVTRTVSKSQYPFNVNAERFPDTTSDGLPGPTDYVPKVGLWVDVKKKGHSRYSQYTAPFDSSSTRTTGFTLPDVLCIPGPDLYYPQLQKKGDQNQSYMFASKSKRDPTKTNQNIPGPDTYSVVEPFKQLTTQKSHLQTKDSAFLTSSERMTALEWSDSPGPDTYDTVQSSLNTKGGVIGMKLRCKGIEKTPSPAHYKINPKYEKSGVLLTNNITLKKKPKPKPDNKKRRQSEKKKNKEIVGRLQCFSVASFPTRHCSIDHAKEN